MNGPDSADDPRSGESDPRLTDDEDALTDLLAACDEKIAAGEEPSTDASAEETDEALVPRFKKRLDCLRLLDRLRPGRDGDPSAFPYESPDSSWRYGHPTRIGRFQVRRKLGHGGFGSVYLAYDPKLRRQLALKVPHPRTILTAELRERFKREAETAAALDHRNVVPVYESGEAGPLCYIAAAYCPGISLAAWLREQRDPVPARSAAALVAQIAEGVHHAHERGVLHRDLKPGNVLLTPIRAGTPIEDSPTVEMGAAASWDVLDFLPRITDFGMAKRVGEWDSSGGVNEDPAAPLTMSGAIMGTPTYMAPEQAAGRTRDVSRATDVHGLGIILYELLVGRPPFLAESASDIIRRVQSDEPLPPRKLRPKLPRDLETICLKCLEKEPKRRYPTAGDLAADLNRFLDGRTIEARSVGKVERAWRWSLREPLVAGLLASLVVVVGSALAITSTMWVRERAQAARAMKREDEAVAARLSEIKARQEAEENLRVLRAMMDDFTNVAREMSDEPSQRRIKRRMMERLLDFHQRFLAVKGNDPEVLHQARHAYESVGQIQVELGKLDEAEKAYLRAVELGWQLDAVAPDVAVYRHEHALTCYWYAYFLIRRRGLLKEGLAHLDTGLDIVRDLHDHEPDGRYYNNSYALLLSNWASTQMGLGNQAMAKRAFPTIIDLEREAIAENPRAHSTRENLALSLMTRAWIEANERDFAAEERSLRESERVMRDLVEEVPHVANFRYTYCRSLNNLGAFLHRHRRFEESEKHYRHALEIARELMKTHSEVVDYQGMVADLAANLGHDLPKNRREEAYRDIKIALDASRELVERFPDVAEYREKLARSLILMANRTEPEDGEEAFELVKLHLKYRPHNAYELNRLAWWIATTPNPRLRDYPLAVALSRSLVVQAGDDLDNANTWGVSEYRAGNFETARRVLATCVDRRPIPLPEDHLFLAMTQFRLGEKQEAERNRAAAYGLMKYARRPDPDWDRLRAEADALFAGRPSP